MKCRFCGSMLTPGGSAIANSAANEGQTSQPPSAVNVLFEGSPSWKAWFWPYVLAGILSLVLVGLIWIWVLQIRRRSMRYRITDAGIDSETGTFSRKIETVQLWRVKHVDFEQTLFQRMLGISEIHVTTTDGEDQRLVLRGLTEGREVFNRLRDALQLARQRQVVGITQ